MNYEQIMEHKLPDNYLVELSPTDFEKIVKDYLTEVGKDLTAFEVSHNVKEKTSDGTYQIDVKATFEVFGGSNIVALVECKKYNQPVKREKVEILHSRLQSIGAHKGMIFSTSAFQQGAIEFAIKHGIALVRLKEGIFSYETRSLFNENNAKPYWPDMSKYVGVFLHDIRDEKCSVTNLQKGHLSPLREFIYGHENLS